MAEQDAITVALISAQVEETTHLWAPFDAITFTPHVLNEIFGDGRALFAFGTLNSRPAYWIVRADSSWTSDSDYGEEPPEDAINFADKSEEILCALEEEFGRASCGCEYEYNSAGRPYDPETGRLLSRSEIEYPVVNTGGGWHWGRLDWPDLPGIDFVPHPLHPRVRILAASPTASGTGDKGAFEALAEFQSPLQNAGGA